MTILERAYKDLIKGDLTNAAKGFKSLADFDIRARWGLFLADLLGDRFERYPTYFQVRNFLEIDLQQLIDNCKGDYAEKIAGYADFFFSVNPESYKFLARVMAANGFVEPTRFFLARARERLYSDPEMHFIAAGIELTDGRHDAAKKAIDECLAILPEYYPAVKLLTKLRQENIIA